MISIGDIIISAIKIMLALLAVYLYFYLICKIYPWFTMTLVFKGKKYLPRGRRKVVFEGGRGVVYESPLEFRRYIPQYAIFVTDGNKYIRCRINSNIEHIKYDIISFNLKGKMLDVVSVKEHVSKEGDTAPIALPTETAYVCVIPRKVDRLYKNNKKAVGYSKVGCGIFFGLTVLTTVVMSWFVNDALSHLFSLMYVDFVAANVFEVFVRAFVCGAVMGGAALLMYHIHRVKVVNR